MGEIGVAVVVAARRRRATFTRANCASSPRRTSRAYKLPEALRRRRHRSRSPWARRSIGGARAQVVTPIGRADTVDHARQVPERARSPCTWSSQANRTSCATACAPCSPVSAPCSAGAPGRREGPTPDALWSQMVELGWPALTVPEARRGARAGRGRARASSSRSSGACIAPGPLRTDRDAVRRRSSPKPARPSSRQRFLGASRGRASHGHARARRGERQRSTRGTSRRRPHRTATAVVLEGPRRRSSRPRRPTTIAVIARTRGTRGDDGVGAFVVSCADARLDPVDALDPSRPLADVASTASGSAETAPSAMPGPATAAAIRRAVEVAATALAVETVGATQAIFDITLEYAKQREQFGAPIGSLPGDQAQVRRHARGARTGARDRLLRRAHDRRGRRPPGAGDVDGEGAAGDCRRCSPRRASRSTAASATRGSTTCTCTCAA